MLRVRVQFYLVVSLVLAVTAICDPRLSVVGAQSDDAEIRSVVRDVFEALERKDLNKISSLWSEKSPDLAAARQRFAVLVFAAVGANRSKDLQAVSTQHPTAVRTKDMNQLAVTVRSVEAKQDKWRVELSVHNAGESAVFAMADPVRSDRSLGPYIAIAPSDTLDIGAVLHYPPPYSLYVNDARVKLKRVEPGSTLRETFNVEIPFTETIPPYGDTPQRHTVDHTTIKFVKGSVGVIPDEEAVREVLDRKPAGRFVYGLEQLVVGSFKGKRLIDLQTVISSKALKV